MRSGSESGAVGEEHEVNFAHVAFEKPMAYSSEMSNGELGVQHRENKARDKTCSLLSELQ